MILGILLTTALLNVGTEELYYFNPSDSWVTVSESRALGVGSIPREFHEKLLSYKTDWGGRVNTLIVLANKDYDTVCKYAREVLLAKVGLAAESSTKTGPISRLPKQYPEYLGVDLDWPMLGEGLSHLAPVSLKSPVPECQFVSDHYNRLESKGAFSQVRLRVSDANELLGKEVAILQISRLDFSREWALLHPFPFPLPYKENYMSVLVTNTEVALVEQLKTRITGLVLRYFVLPTGTLEGHISDKEQLLKSMHAAVK